MSDEDRAAYRRLVLISVLAIFGMLFMFSFGALYAEHACFELVFRSIPLPDGCSNGSLTRFVLELSAIIVGTLGAIRFLG
jgi:hypothetical protein